MVRQHLWRSPWPSGALLLAALCSMFPVRCGAAGSLARAEPAAAAVSSSAPGLTAPVDLSLASELPSGDPVNDRIWLTFYPPVQAVRQPAPAVVLLHFIGAATNEGLRQYARYLAERGIGAAVMELPYHMRRRVRGEAPYLHYVGPDVDTVVQSLSQSASDVSRVVTWLSRQPVVDARRIGAVGVSLGAIVVHLAMGKDERIGAGVALLGSGNLADMYLHSPLSRLVLKKRFRADLGAAEQERLRQVDPLTYAGRNQPRHVLMVQAARDQIMLPHDAEALWNALGRPPIQWLDTNHLALSLAVPAAMRTSTAYLQAVWRGDFAARSVPLIHAPTLKAGLLVGLDSVVTPAVEWQAWSFAQRRDHMSLLHADLGWSGRGPFIGLAATVTSALDIGVAHRFFGHATRPYASLHVVF